MTKAGREELELEQLRALVEARRQLRSAATVEQLERAERQQLLTTKRAAARGHLAKARLGDKAAARAAVEALPRQVERLLEAPPSRARTKRIRYTLAETAAAVKAAYETEERRGRGHVAVMRDKYTYVQQEDLDDLVPDGWGKRFPGELRRIGRHHELPPLAIATMVLLSWCFQFRESERGDLRRKGAGAQFSAEWLARKLGCWPSWVHNGVFNRLDPFVEWRREVQAVKRSNWKLRKAHRRLRKEPPRPRGTPYIERHRRLKRYQATKQRDGGNAAAWIDKNGKPRFFVDVRGVCYVTEAGRALLGRLRAPPHEGMDSEPATAAGADLGRRLKPVAWNVERRLTKYRKKSTDPPARAAL